MNSGFRLFLTITPFPALPTPDHRPGLNCGDDVGGSAGKWLVANYPGRPGALGLVPCCLWLTAAVWRRSRNTGFGPKVALPLLWRGVTAALWGSMGRGAAAPSRAGFGHTEVWILRTGFPGLRGGGAWVARVALLLAPCFLEVKCVARRGWLARRGWAFAGLPLLIWEPSTSDKILSLALASALRSRGQLDICLPRTTAPLALPVEAPPALLLSGEALSLPSAN